MEPDPLWGSISPTRDPRPRGTRGGVLFAPKYLLDSAHLAVFLAYRQSFTETLVNERI